MENFNKNWLIILLTAVVFGSIGFLFGKVCGNPYGFGNKHNKWEHKCDKMSSCMDKEIMLDVDLDEIIESEDIEKYSDDSGKVIVIKKVIK